MSPQWRLALRTLFVALLGWLITWQAADEPFTKAAATGLAIALLQAVVEILGPTSDAGVKWE